MRHCPKSQNHPTEHETEATVASRPVSFFCEKIRLRNNGQKIYSHSYVRRGLQKIGLDSLNAVNSSHVASMGSFWHRRCAAAFCVWSQTSQSQRGVVMVSRFTGSTDFSRIFSISFSSIASLPRALSRVKTSWLLSFLSLYWFFASSQWRNVELSRTLEISYNFLCF